MALTSGSTLARRYRLARLLGEGGMGEVWSATHVVTGRRLAIKRLLCPSGGGAFNAARARFLLEARSACAVDHPNVVQVFDIVEQGRDAPFIVMELLEGETLAARLRREPVLHWRTTAELLLPVVSAVGTAHARGIVHRDLKPSNIFLVHAQGDIPLVKVLDFGIAKWMGATSSGDGPKTETGSTLGTPSYMAPEQATGDRGIDHRADIWSLGVIAYECLSGARPVEGENPTQMMLRLLSSGIMPIERLVPGLPEDWASLIGRMLSREPSRRPVDLREVHDVLAASSARGCLTFGAPSSQEPSALLPVAETAASAGTGRFRKGRAAVWFGSLSLIGAAVLAIGLAGKRTPADVSPGELAVASLPPVADEALHTSASESPREPGAELLPAGAPAAATPAPRPERLKAPASAVNGLREKRSTPRNATAPNAPARRGLPPGEPCERSEQCDSHFCVALSCR